MKNRFKNENQDNNQDEEYEEYDDSVEVDDDITGVAGSKSGKMLIIVASAILVTLVVYFLFFSGEGSKKAADIAITKLEGEIDAIESKIIEEPEEIFPEEEVVLSKPEAPEVPKLPSLPELPSSIIEKEPEVKTLPPFVPVPDDPKEVKEEKKEEKEKVVEKPVEEKEAIPEYDPRRSPIIAVSGGAGPTLGVGYENNIINLVEDPIGNLDQAKSGVTPTVIGDREHTIAQGKLMTAVLETAINTEVPGNIRGIISRDVYGEAGRKVLIPKGSRLYGTYSTRILRGQGRVEVSWNRLIRPDGVDVSITFNASDQFGRAGIEGDIDNKYGTAIANSLLTSVLAVGGSILAEKISGGGSTTTTTSADGNVTTTGKASNQVIADVSQTIVDTITTIATNAIDLSPIIRVPQGTKMTIVVNSDMKLPPLRHYNN